MRTDEGLTRTGFKAVWTSYYDPDAAAIAAAAAATAAAVDTINCITSDLLRSCRSCVCTLLCYWSPTDDLCKACLIHPQLASLFLHHQHCPQGWVYSAASSSCLKSYDQRKPWSRAARFCEDGGGRLAQPASTASIQTVLESINMVASADHYWLGGQVDRPGVGGWHWLPDNNWATGYPLSGLVKFTS